MAPSEFREALDRLGLSQYHDGLVQEAFDSWEVLADITEEDLYVVDPPADEGFHADDRTEMPWESSWDTAGYAYSLAAALPAPCCRCKCTDKHDRYCNVPSRIIVKTNHNLSPQPSQLYNTLPKPPSWRTRQRSQPRARILETMLHHEQRQATSANTDDTQR